MNENVKYGAAGLAVVGLTIGGIVYFSQRHPAPPPPEPVVATPEPAPVAPAEDTIEHPLAAPEKPAPLPALNDSDGPARSALSELLGKDPVFDGVVYMLKELSVDTIADRRGDAVGIDQQHGYLRLTG